MKSISKANRLALAVAAIFVVIVPIVLWLNRNSGRSFGPTFQSRLAFPLKFIGLGIYNYEETHKHLPLAATVGENHEPLFSWRLSLSQHNDDSKDFDDFHVKESWDSSHNKTFLTKIPRYYRAFENGTSEAAKTPYMLPVGKEMIFDGDRKATLTDIQDGVSNTILVVEVDPSRMIYWTQPGDYAVDKNSPLQGLRLFGSGHFVVMADGTVRQVSAEMSPTNAWGLFTASGGEKVELPQ